MNSDLEDLYGNALFLAGPTASGKTALALAAAELLDAEIVNADSMQVYADLAILSARPTPEETARAPHHLFGHVDAAAHYSVGRWRDEALGVLADIAARGRTAIVVGGTGLYFKALSDGLADAPDPGEEARAYASDVLGTRGLEGLHALAQELDPDAAAKVEPTDRHRLMRIVAFVHGVGEPLSSVVAATAPPRLPAPWRALVLEPDRAALYARIDARAQAMLADGAVEEAARLAARGLADRPALKALGVETLGQLANGEIDAREACETLARQTRRYAKRQLTWFRNQTPDWPRIIAPDADAAIAAWCGQSPK